MANCENLCTAAKCEELENRIVVLENLIIQLQNELTDLTTEVTEHIDKPLSQSHTWDLYFDGSLWYDVDYQDIHIGLNVYSDDDTWLTGFYSYTTWLPYVTVSEFAEHLNLSIPEAHEYIPDVQVFVTEQNDGSSLIEVSIDEIYVGEALFNTESLGLTITENNGEYDFEVSLGNKTANDTLNITNAINDNISNSINNLDFFFRIDELSNNDYDFVLTIGDRTRSQILDLPAFGGGGGGGTTEPPVITTSMSGYYDAIANNLNISTTVSGNTGSTIINLDEMTFPDIITKLDQILDAINFEVTGIYEIGKTDTSLLDADGNKKIDYAEYKTLTEGQEGYIDTSYVGNGFDGINQAFLALDKKITCLHKDLSKAIDPEMSIEVIAPTTCYDNVSRNDYTDEEWDNLPVEIQAEIEKSVFDRFGDFISRNPILSEIAEPLLRSVGSLAYKIPSLPAFFAINFASNFLIHQLKDDAPLNCSYVKPQNLPTEIETVTIVASPEVQANIKDTVLVLDFTTVEAFPGLNEKKNKWRIQIPSPIADINWNVLKNIRWFRGGQYGKLKFKGRRNYTSGWFKDKNSGDAYFSYISNLTTLETENIIYSIHSNPKISPIEIETRVYRGYKVFMGENGEPNSSLTEVIKPPLENESL